MFFKLDKYDRTCEKICFSKACEINCDGFEYADFLTESLRAITLRGEIAAVCTSVDFVSGFPKRIKDKIGTISSDEAYAIEIGKRTKIYSGDQRGFIYAVMTLCQLAESDELYCGFVYDAPVCDVRGYRVFLPKREGFEDFKRMVDLLAYYKYNAIMLEIGGAMEYERHPEINQRWAEFCRETHAYSGRTHEIQHKTYPWRKNSIHTDNAEGDILTKAECRELASYCRSRGLEVIPECPTLSHCDYIVMAHPEIREREGDEYPDTYCPNHPDTYPLVFDILDEVIEVFCPKEINIGHDEAYSISICKRCRKTPAPVNYANDIKKIKAYLDDRGVKTVMWGEKLLNAHSGREAIGGAGHGKGLAKVNALYPCRDLLPNDITMLHWYYVFNPDYDKVYHERGMKMVFGNLNALDVEKWDERVRGGAKGGYVSNWGSFGEEYMQRNLQYFALISSAYAFWHLGFGKLSREEKLHLTSRELYRLKRIKIKNPLTVTHTAYHNMKYKWFYDGIFIVDENFLLGEYVLRYSDGECARLPVKFGTNIGAYKYDDYLNEAAFREVMYTTMPERFGAGFAYECVYEDPRPDGELVGITYEPKSGKEDVKVELVSFSRTRKSETLFEGKRHFSGEAFAWDGGTLDRDE